MWQEPFITVLNYCLEKVEVFRIVAVHWVAWWALQEMVNCSPKATARLRNLKGRGTSSFSLPHLCLPSHPLLCNPKPLNHQGYLLKCTQSLTPWSLTHVHWGSDAIQPSHPLSSPSPTFSLSWHQGLFQWVRYLQQVAKLMEPQLQYRSLQWIFRVDFL